MKLWSSPGRASLACVLSLAGVAGCGPKLILDDLEGVQSWHGASAPWVFSSAFDEIAHSDGRFDYNDPACPVIVDDGTTISFTGGCSEAGTNRTWLGSAELVRTGAGGRSLTYTDFGSENLDSDRNITDGTFVIDELDPLTHTFEANLTREGTAFAVKSSAEFTTLSVVEGYVGSVAGDYDSATTWNGEGRITRTGERFPGTVDAETRDEVLDSSICSEPLSGETWLRAEGLTAVLLYDGATDCDADLSVPWTLDGELQDDPVTNVRCSVTRVGPERTSGLWAVGLLATLLAVALRRRAAPGESKSRLE